jgi:hypothetical protein
MTHMFAPTPLPLSQGLLHWTRAQSPAMWHEMACGMDFASPKATVDLLMAADWITRQPGCCRATALMLLARMVEADLHRNAPAHMAPEAAQALTLQLHAALARGRFATAEFRLTPAQSALVQALFGATGPLPLPPAALTHGRAHAHAPYAFVGHRPVQAAPAMTLAA